MAPRSRWTHVLSMAMTAAALALSACGTAKPPEPAPPTVAEAAPATAPAPTPTPVPPTPTAKGRPSTDLIDRKVLFGNPSRARVTISPDGKLLAWLAPKDGVLNVFVAPVGKLDQARAVTADTTRPVRVYYWAFDNQHLLYQQDVGGNENFHLFRVSLADGKTTDLTPGEKVRAEVIGLSHRKPGAMLMSSNERDPAVFDAYLLDLATGNKKLVAQNQLAFAGWLSDDDLVIRNGVKIDGDGSTVTFAPDGKGGWKEVDRAGPRDAVRQLVFSKRGDQLYLTDDRGRDTAGLYVMDLKTKAKKLLFADDRADVEDVLFHPTENKPLAATVNWDRSRLEVLDKSVAGDLAALAALGEGDLAINSATKDNKTWVVVLNSDRQPVRYFLWDRSKQKATFLFSSRPELENVPLARMHPVVIDARDGLRLVSYLTLPTAADPNGDGKPDAKVPAVLLVHGGPWARDDWGFSGFHQLLANRGYAVLSVNFRGSTGFGKKFLNAGNGEWGKKMHDDLLDATAWLVAQGISPADKVCIMGGSYGGYATLAGLALTPDTFACGVDIVGPSNILTLLGSIPPYWAPILGLFQFRVGEWASPEGKARLLAVSPLTHAAAIKRPLLIAQGANDPRVKQTESDQIVAAMKAKHLPVSYLLFPDEGHGFARPENNLVFLAATEAFLSAHLGGVYQPVSSAELGASSVKVLEGRDGIPSWP